MKRNGDRAPYEPHAVYRLAERARSQGVDLAAALGPWRADKRQFQRQGRTSLPRHTGWKDRSARLG